MRRRRTAAASAGSRTASRCWCRRAARHARTPCRSSTGRRAPASCSRRRPRYTGRLRPSLHGASRVSDGAQSRRAEAVDGLPGDGGRQPRQQQRHPRDVAIVFARLIGAPEDDVGDLRRVHLRQCERAVAGSPAPPYRPAAPRSGSRQRSRSGSSRHRRCMRHSFLTFIRPRRVLFDTPCRERAPRADLPDCGRSLGSTPAARRRASSTADAVSTSPQREPAPRTKSHSRRSSSAARACSMRTPARCRRAQTSRLHDTRRSR